MSVTVTILGTGNPIPDPNRAGPSNLVRAGETTLLVDAGRGVTMRLAGAGVLPIMLNGVLLTHLHSDHISDLNDVITSHWVMSQAPTQLHVYGPPGTQQVVDGLLAMLALDIKYRLDHHEDLTWRPQVVVTELDVPEGETIDVQIGDATVEVARTDHRPVEPTVGFRFEHEGRSVVLAGDGIPCAGLDALCAGADVYVQTVVRADLVSLIPNQRFRDILDYHSSVEQAADTAQRAGVGTLVLTHYVPAPGPDQLDDWRALAAAVFSGTIVLADDLTVV